MDIYTILSIVAYVIIILVATVINAIKNKNADKKMQTAAELEAAKQEIINSIPSLMAEAEQVFTGEKDGVKRLNYCMTKLTLACLQKGVSFVEGELETIIQNLCEMSKVVNV